MGYIFMGAVPRFWCHIPELEMSGWTLNQIQNLSIPKDYSLVEITHFQNFSRVPMYIS